jgi:RNA polymerase sigma-70 factor, ECF subfamily
VRNEEKATVEEIIAAVKRGETEKFRLLVREYGFFVRGYFAARLSHQDDADDLAQEVFLIAFAKLETCDPASLSGWLVGIARNQLRNHWRARMRREDAHSRFRREVTEIIDTELDAEAARYTPAAIERLLHCISLLPERLRKIVQAGLEGARAAALVDELGITANALYQARFRAHAALRKCMEGWDSASPV